MSLKKSRGPEILIAIGVGALFCALSELFQATKITSGLLKSGGELVNGLKTHDPSSLVTVIQTLSAALLVTVLVLGPWLITVIARNRRLQKLGVLDYNERAELGIQDSITHAQTRVNWHGYSSVNVVTNVSTEKLIRAKSAQGVSFHFNILDPDSTFAYMLHAKHEKNHEDQGKGYIVRALSSILEMGRDKVRIEYSHFYLPPILRIVTADNSRMHVAYYPDGQCGIDSGELIVDGTNSPFLFKLFSNYVTRYNEIGEYLRLRDTVISLLIRTAIPKENLPLALSSLRLPAANSDFMRIIRLDLPTLYDMAQGINFEQGALLMAARNPSSSIGAEVFLDSKIQSAAAAHEALILSFETAVRRAGVLQRVSVSNKAGNIKAEGVLVPSPSNVGTRRAFSGWVSHAIISAHSADGQFDQATLKLATAHHGKLLQFHQFSLNSDETLVLAWGDNAAELIDAAINAARTFRAENFDEDGYSR